MVTCISEGLYLLFWSVASNLFVLFYVLSMDPVYIAKYEEIHGK